MARGLRLCVAAGFMLLESVFSAAYAFSNEYILNIPPLKLSDALGRLSEATGNSLFYVTDDLPSLTTRPLQGSYELEDALDVLLGGTNLTATVTEGGVIVVAVAPQHREQKKGFAMNQSKRKSSLLSTVAGLVSAGAVAATAPVQAQDDTIIVTAQKREQDINDVPIAISAFNAKFLDDANINDITDLKRFVPGFTVISEQSPAQTNLNIRGFGTSGSNISLESSVGLYVDGVYRSRQASALNNLIDVERVEVIKGPQGTLFGKNTVAGAVQIVSVAPDLDGYDAFVEVNAGSLNYRNVNGAVNIPIVTGELAVRLSGGMSDREGYVTNIVTGNKVNNLNRYGFRGQVLWEPSADLSIRIIGDTQKLDEFCCSQNVVYEGPSEAFYRNTLGAVIGRADQYNDDITTADNDSTVLLQENGVSGEINWNVGGVTLTSLTAYRKYRHTNVFDGDQSSLRILENNEQTDQKTFTQELRVAGNLFEDSVNYIAGFYYFNQDIDGDRQLPLLGDLNAALGNPTNGTYLGGALGCAARGVSAICDDPVFMDGDEVGRVTFQKQKSYAIFAQADLNLTESLIVTIGGRYLDEDKSLDALYYESRFNPAWEAITVFSPAIPDIDNETFSDSAFTGTAKVTYHWSDDFMTYLSFGRGYKSGGTNIDRLNTSVPGIEQVFGPETSNSYEFGFKGRLFNGLRFNGAVFAVKFDDFQANTYTVNSFVLSNAGKVSSEGVELDFSYRPSSWLTLAGGGTYIDAKYDSFVGGPCISTGVSPDAGEPNYPTTCDVSGRRVSGTPKWSGYGSVAIEHQLASGNTLYGRADASWRSETPIGAENDPNKTLDGYTLTNLRAGLRFGDGRFDISGWAKNIFDVDYNKGPYNTTFRGGSLTDNHTEPRTYGATLRIRM